MKARCVKSSLGELSPGLSICHNKSLKSDFVGPFRQGALLGCTGDLPRALLVSCFVDIRVD